MVIGQTNIGDNMKDFLAAFNAFQLVILFACLPFIVSWLWGAPFAGASALVWVAIVVYVILFFFVVGCVSNSIFGSK